MSAGPRDAPFRVVVDAEACEGQSVCVGIAPTVFQLGAVEDLVRIQIGELPAELREAVADAVDRCPRAALHLRQG